MITDKRMCEHLIDRKEYYTLGIFVAWLQVERPHNPCKRLGIVRWLQLADKLKWDLLCMHFVMIVERYVSLHVVHIAND